MNDDKNKNGTVKKQREAKKFAIDVTWVFSSVLIGLFTGLIFKILLGNYFGAKGLGLFSMVAILTAFATIIGNFGVPAALVKFISEHQENKKKVNELISCGLINAFLLGLVFTFLFIILSDYFAALFNMPELSFLLKVVSIMFPFLLVNDIFSGIYNGFRWMNKYTYFMTIRKTGLLIIAWIFILFGFSVIAAILAMVIKELVLFVINIILIRNYKIKILFKGHFTVSKELFNFSKYLFFTYQVGYVNEHLDMFLIGFFLTDEHVGIYAAAMMIIHFFLTIPEAISRVVLPMTSEYYGKRLKKKIERALNIIMRYSFVIASILGLLIIFFGKLFLRIIFPGHPEFVDAYYPLIILIAGTLIFSIFYCFGGIFTAYGRPDVSLKVAGITGIINFCLNLYLIPIYGLVGGALATSVSYVISSLIFFILLKRMLKISIISNWVIIGLISFYGTIAIFFGLQFLINPYLLIIILFPSYIAVAYFSKIFTQEDMQYLRGIIIKKGK